MINKITDKKILRCLFCERALAYQFEGHIEVMTKNSQSMVVGTSQWEGRCKCGTVITVSGMLMHFSFKNSA